jgi:pyridoxine 4-dehydrogenase
LGECHNGNRFVLAQIPRRLEQEMSTTTLTKAGTFQIGGESTVVRLGCGAMQLTGPGVWGEPKDRPQALRVLRRAVELGVNFIDTADSCGRSSPSS